MSTWVIKRAKELGLPVEDASKGMEIRVLPDDVKKAKVKNAKCCAFARAAKRQVPRIVAAYFFRSVAYLEYSDKVVRYALPLAMQKEIVSFDRAQKMAPGVYALAKAPESQSLAAMRKSVKGKTWTDRSKAARSAPTRGKMGPSRRVRHKTPGVRTLQEPADE